MRTLKTIIGASLLATVGSACSGTQLVGPDGQTATVVGSGRLQSESRAVQPFSEISVNAGARVDLQQTGIESLQITAEDNVLPFAEAEVRNGQLTLRLKSGVSLTTNHGVLYRVTVRTLERIEATSGSRVELHGFDGRTLVIRFSGGSTLDASGSVDRLVADLTGGSRCMAAALRAREARFSISGGSYALIRVVESLVAEAAGGSILEYLGDPVLHAEVSAGTIVRRVGP